MTIIGAFASFFLKKSSSSSNIKKLLLNRQFYFGGFLYFITAIINIIILKHLPYSIVLPLTALTYVWTLIIAYLLLDEKITKTKIMGIILIVIGAVFLV
jgi:drug/metabolite transporter (DMT)-like permease